MIASRWLVVSLDKYRRLHAGTTIDGGALRPCYAARLWPIDTIYGPTSYLLACQCASSIRSILLRIAHRVCATMKSSGIKECAKEQERIRPPGRQWRRATPGTRYPTDWARPARPSAPRQTPPRRQSTRDTSARRYSHYLLLGVPASSQCSAHSSSNIQKKS